MYTEILLSLYVGEAIWEVVGDNPSNDLFGCVGSKEIKYLSIQL
jgi:hypothetical protein